ncbi:nucleotidyltransferase family protein [Sulfurovum riftiae]|uniref:Polymerase beta nucleotidyltransferase domain-containing protein n=1 Tax=Sulfurovum riftiae TaxID=1630136 RepID=A0A151CD97_9BACT|nr:nucleotidyltransferase domain-containing protein [Sulfurovum riftiae]KYJ85475.1 hypothetical protein AS592_03950 [Sulfurovum riftiae]
MKQTIQHIVRILESAKKQYEEEGIRIIGIFGSYARGTEDRYSDIDIAYIVDHTVFDQKFKGGFAKLLRLEEIKSELQQYLHRKVDLVPFNGGNDRLVQRMKQEMVYV